MEFLVGSRFRPRPRFPARPGQAKGWDHLMATVAGRTRKRKAAGSGKREPAWDIATFFPLQGDWTEEEYLAFERDAGNRLIELVDGCVEVLPVPSLRHQRIAKWMLRRVDDFIVPRNLGEAQMAPLPVKLFSGQIR